MNRTVALLVIVTALAACAEPYHDQGDRYAGRDRGYRNERAADNYSRHDQSNYGRQPRIDPRDHRALVPNPDDRGELWRQHYSREYSYNDDPAYSDCRNGPDPMGVLMGAVIGGLVGNVAGRGGGGSTVAGVIAGGAIGAALTANLDCEDRSYAYKTYSDGFNSGRPGSDYRWNNPNNNHRGEMRVLDYYTDEDGFRCAVYSHTVNTQRGLREAHGRACQQPDGTWAIID